MYFITGNINARLELHDKKFITVDETFTTVDNKLEDVDTDLREVKANVGQMTEGKYITTICLKKNIDSFSTRVTQILILQNTFFIIIEYLNCCNKPLSD